MSALTRIAENRIQEAMERGEFESLEGRGQPLNLEDYFSAPPAWRAAYALMKQAGFLPREVELLQEIASLREQLAAAEGSLRSQILRKLTDQSLELNLLLERQQRWRRG
ncbi:MAG: DUF1992 domain-containing protein [Chloroflexi bacterium]|jgi:hypothetical protein|nr:DUF1992 domain-containing protein [Chloroflexota bacterium]